MTAQASRAEGAAQVFPLGICGLDQRLLLLAAPALNLFLASDGRADITEGLEVNEAADVVAAGEAGHEFARVLEKAARQVVGQADVECGGLARKDVNEVGLHGAGRYGGILIRGLLFVSSRRSASGKREAVLLAKAGAVLDIPLGGFWRGRYRQDAAQFERLAVHKPFKVATDLLKFEQIATLI
jgi:hypothetical protein